jgi:hypothetical protein
MASRKITYIRLLEKIKLKDGTVLEKGTSVRFNYKEGPFLNVELHDSHNVKRIFWITEDKGKVSATRTESWTSKMMSEYQKDLAETWLDGNGEKKKDRPEGVKEKKAKKTTKK